MRRIDKKRHSLTEEDEPVFSGFLNGINEEAPLLKWVGIGLLIIGAILVFLNLNFGCAFIALPFAMMFYLHHEFSKVIKSRQKTYSHEDLVQLYLKAKGLEFLEYYRKRKNIKNQGSTSVEDEQEDKRKAS